MNSEKTVGVRAQDEGRTDWDKLGDMRQPDGGKTSWEDLRKEEFRGQKPRERAKVEVASFVITPEGTGDDDSTMAEGAEEDSDSATTERTADGGGLAVIEEAAKETKEMMRPVAEMEPREIAREYLDILHGLGKNFTSPEGKSARLVRSDGSVSERKYSGDEGFVKRIYKLGGMSGEESEEDLDRALNLRMVDSILEGEQRWRDAGEEYKAAETTIAKSNERLEQLKKEGKSMGLLGRVRTFAARHKEKKELKEAIKQAQDMMPSMELKTMKSDKKLGEDLRAAYSEDYHYGHHRDSYEHQRDKGYQERMNEEYNQRFTEGHEEEIARAIELRKALLKLKHGKLYRERPAVDDWHDSLQR